MHLIGQISINDDIKTPQAQTERVASEEVISSPPSDNIPNPLHPVLLKDVKLSLVPRRYFCNEWLKDPEAKMNSKLVILQKFITSHIPQNYTLDMSVGQLICRLSYQLSKLWNMGPKKEEDFLNQITDWLNKSPLNFILRKHSENNTNWEHKPKIKTTDNEEHKPEKNTKLPPIPTPQTTVPEKQVSDEKIKLEKYFDVFDLLRKSKPSFQPDVFIHILTNGNDCKDLNEENKATIINFANRVVTDMRFKWLTANSQEKLFEDKFGYWLQLNIKWPDCLKTIIFERNAKYDADVQASITSKSHKQSYLEQTLTEKLSEVGCNDISEVIHRLVYHPEEAASIKAFVTKSQCKCKQTETEVDDDVEIKSERSSPDKDDPLRLPKNRTPETTSNSGNKPSRIYSNPSNAQRIMLREVLDRLKVNNNINKPSHNRKVEKYDGEEVSSEEESSKEEEPDAVDDNDVEEVVRNEDVYEVETLDEEGSEEEVLDQEVFKVEALDQEEINEEQTVHAEREVTEVPTLNTRKPLELRSGPNLKPVFMILPGQKLQTLDFGPVLDRALFLSSNTISPDILKNTKKGNTITLNNTMSGTVVKISNLKNAVAVLPNLDNKKGMKVLPRQRRMTMVKPNIKSITNVKQATYQKQQSVIKSDPNINMINPEQSMIQATPSTISSRFKILASSPTRVQEKPTNLATSFVIPSNIKSNSVLQKTPNNSKQAVEANNVSKTSSQKVTLLKAQLASAYTPVTSSKETKKLPLILARNIKVIPKASSKTSVFTISKSGLKELEAKSSQHLKGNVGLLDDINRGSFKSEADKNNDEPPTKKILLESFLKKL